ncbi:MAG: SDR family oxidoreductase [Betaproteobacteria bacterium]|nr:SDR family oxidoreductase [Betaproteobacteria bacterium]
MSQLLNGLRIVVTQAKEFMGPALCQVLSSHGATVLADTRALHHPDAPQALIQSHGHIDVLVANLAMTAPSTPATEVQDAEWSEVFDTMVHPLPRLLRAVMPQMQTRGRGKLLVMGSASALRGMKRASSYSAARGAQLAWVQAVGVELAAMNIQVNAIAQNFVENPTYFPPEVQANPRFAERLQREVPLGRLVKADEDAEFAAYLCSDKADCFVGQVFPVCGGWVQR